MITRLFVYISLVALVGCAAGPKIDSIANRQIDRGHVLHGLFAGAAHF